MAGELDCTPEIKGGSIGLLQTLLLVRELSEDEEEEEDTEESEQDAEYRSTM
jgi:hypothetical protein